MTVAPTHEPTAPATTRPICADQPVKWMPRKWMPLFQARCAAGGITTSLGSGTIELSMAISKATSAKPPLSSVRRYQSMSVLNMRRLLIAETGAQRKHWEGERREPKHPEKSGL